ncbi:hypothetical protein PHJA_002023500, partial [Phtheirospermum japonicum]
GVRSQKYSHLCPLTSIPRASYPFLLNHDGGPNQNRKTHIGFRDNQARTDDFHHVKVTPIYIYIYMQTGGTCQQNPENVDGPVSII